MLHTCHQNPTATGRYLVDTLIHCRTFVFLQMMAWNIVGAHQEIFAIRRFQVFRALRQVKILSAL